MQRYWARAFEKKTSHKRSDSMPHADTRDPQVILMKRHVCYGLTTCMLQCSSILGHSYTWLTATKQSPRPPTATLQRGAAFFSFTACRRHFVTKALARPCGAPTQRGPPKRLLSWLKRPAIRSVYWIIQTPKHTSSNFWAPLFHASLQRMRRSHHSRAGSPTKQDRKFAHPCLHLICVQMQTRSVT